MQPAVTLKKLQSKPAMNVLSLLWSDFHTSPWAGKLESADVHIVQAFEYKRAAACLAEAFAVDEVARYFTHTPDTAHWTSDQKWALHLSILEYIVYAHVLNGVVLSTGNFDCVALW